MSYQHCPHEVTGDNPPPWMCMPCWALLSFAAKKRFYTISGRNERYARQAVVR